MKKNIFLYMAIIMIVLLIVLFATITLTGSSVEYSDIFSDGVSVVF